MRVRCRVRLSDRIVSTTPGLMYQRCYKSNGILTEWQD